MIILFGPPGSGKSTQGKIMAVRHDWQWMSVGELLRQVNNPVINEIMKTGDIVDKDIVNKLLFIAIGDGEKIILDGYPRDENQAKDFLTKYKEMISVVIVLDVHEDEIKQRLSIRKRAEDNDEVVSHRMKIYNETTKPVLGLLEENNIVAKHIDGSGTVGEVHDRIEAVLEDMNIVEEF